LRRNVKPSLGLFALRRRRGGEPAAVALKPDFGRVYWGMANLKVFRFEPEEVAAMEEQLKREDLSASTEVHFRFALGKACEDAGDYERAWAFYHSGNEKQRPLVSYDPVGFESRHEEIAEVFSAEFLGQHAGAGFDQRRGRGATPPLRMRPESPCRHQRRHGGVERAVTA